MNVSRVIRSIINRSVIVRSITVRSIMIRSMFACGVFALVFAAGGVEGNEYKRGNLTCTDFKDAEEKYESDPTGGYADAYALCLLARGDDDLRAVSILEDEIRSRNNVASADLLALYIATGGTMQQYQLDKNNYNEAFHAYAQTLHLINHQLDYPKGFVITEEAEQHELTAYRYMVYISYKKYVTAADSSHNIYLLQSPTYQGDRDLDIYPQYEILDSLQQTIEIAGICANLPLKHHFQPKRYRQTIEYCQVIKRFAGELLVLETKLLTLLNDEECAQDIEQCSEYDEIAMKEIYPLIEKSYSESDRIWYSKTADQ